MNSLLIPNIITENLLKKRKLVNTSTQRHNPIQVENLRKRAKPTIKNATAIGDETEIYVTDVINTLTTFQAECMGSIGDKTDIKVALPNNQIKSIQVKTLTLIPNRDDVYQVTLDTTYNDKMLMVLVNKERNRFGIAFYKEFKDITSSTRLPFNSEISKYKHVMFKNKKAFVEKLLEFIPFSVDWKEDLSDSNKKEFESLKRLKEFCEMNNLDFKRNPTNGNQVDCYINDLPIQCKFASQPPKGVQTFLLHTSTYAGRINGNKISKSYSIDNGFDFIVVEVGGKDNIHFGNFCFIPKSVLFDQEILSSDDCKGKGSMRICPPDYSKSHWSKPYWNKIDPLKQPIKMDSE